MPRPRIGVGAGPPGGNILRLQILPDGAVRVRPGHATDARPVTAREVPDLWRAAALANPRLIAAVETSPETPYGRMIDVLDGLQVAGAERVSLQLLDDPGG